MSFATLTYVVCVLLPWLEDARAAASLAATWALVLFVAGLLRFSRGQNVKGVLAATGALLLVCVYSGVLISFWLLLRHDHSAWVLVGAILTTKSCDTGAYFTGIAFGRHKMIEWLSPKKTWEGLVGGVATAAVVGTLLALWSHQLPHPNDHLPWWIGTIGGVLVALVGQFGDLAESLFKRDAGLKDSGRLLPGMGGVLDVLDSPLMTGPVVYWLLAFALPRG
jgi:phosphatidate cytidylyltransferase